MPPKNKAKKGKKQDDEEFWDKQAGKQAGSTSLGANGGDSEDDARPNGKKASGSAFGMLTADDDGPPEVDENQDFGGLMSALKANASKPKKEKKKAKKGWEDDADLAEAGDEHANGDAAPKGATEATADDLADEEWGPVKEKGKKGKKAKGKKAKAMDEDEDEPPADGDAEATAAKAPVEMTAEELADEEWGAVPDKKKGKKAKGGKKGATPAADDDDDPAAASTPSKPPDDPADAAPADDDAGGDDEEPGSKVLSKKEKEKLKKEREKAKKKAQAAAKKATAADEAPPAPESEPPAPKPAAADKAEADDDDEGDEGAAGGAAAKKKKKKKAAKKDEEAAPAPAAPAKGAKKAGGLSALRQMMEEKKRLEEEARKAEEEERKRLEEEERRAEEEERRREEEKARKKEKEKAKRELAKKEGRLLTKKQKEERAAAEIRRQALLASGVQVEGLQQGGAPAGAPKKVVYGNRKKDNKKGQAKEGSVASESVPATPEVRLSALPDPEPEPEKEVEEQAADGDAKDDWDASSVEEKPAADADVKDDWDASSDEEAAEKKTEPKPAVAKTNGNGVAAPASAKKADAKSPVAAKASPTQEPSKAAPQASTKAAPAAKSAPAKPAAKQQVEEEESESEDEDEEEDSDEDSDDDDSDDDSSEEDSSDDGMTQTQRMAAQKKAEAAERRAKAHEAALAARNKDELRSPICCILGHVDTGKTKLLDKIRQTNVQEGEAGGITQQIGATYFPVDAIKTKTQVLNKDGSFDYKVPGLLVIDTPGHESFTNLRSRGSSLCNIAILVVDIMHGLEPQTLESLRLLRDRKTPFIVALNKIDRMYGWEATPDNGFQDSFAKQKRAVQREFEDRYNRIVTAFAEQGLNAVLYYDNKNFGRYVSVVPTSAITGEGVPDMIMLLVRLTQERMSDRLMYISSLECTVLEVKVIEGLGTTIDVVLVNGYLHEGDKIVVCGLNGAIVTQVRALLTPQPLRELRIKSQYVHHKEVKAALGIKIAAPDLEKAIAGSRLMVVGPDDDEDDMREEVMGDLTNLLTAIDKSGRGVCVQASTLGSLEALLDFLKVSKIPVSGINIGPVHKKDIMRAATMLEKAKELACMLCFDVPVDRDADKLAEELGIKVFKADIIYHLFDAFTAYNAEIMEAKRRDAAPQAIWPCRLKIIATFCKRDPIILGVDILDGTLRVGTPLCVVKVDPTTQKREIIDLGKITSLEINHKTQEVVKKSQAGGGVAVKIEHAVYQSAKMFGRHFDDKDEIISHITRASIDVLKSTFRADVTNEEWGLIKVLKAPLGIQ